LGHAAYFEYCDSRGVVDWRSAAGQQMDAAAAVRERSLTRSRCLRKKGQGLSLSFKRL
jgi:hypothetical protein